MKLLRYTLGVIAFPFAMLFVAVVLSWNVAMEFANDIIGGLK